MSEEGSQETPDDDESTPSGSGVAVDATSGSGAGTRSGTGREPQTTPSAAVPAGSAHPASSGSVVPPRRYAAPAVTRQRPPRWWRILRVVLLVVLLPLIAFAIGLLVAWIVDTIRGHDSVHTSGARQPASSSAAPSASASASASAPPPVVVPADWVVESAPPAGLSYRYPAGWLRRTALPEILRFEPASPGSSAPGIEGVGAGLESVTDPAQAAQDFASRNYGQQPGYTAGAVTAVTGAHAGEKQVVVTYNRSGVDVRVVIHAWRSGEQTVLVLGRSANAQPARAGQLESFIEASLKVGA